MWNLEGAPKGEHSASQPAPPLVEERRVVAWVGKSVIFTGTLESSEDMMVDGRVEGSIRVPNHALTIGPDADIHADIVANTVTIHGKVTGDIRATAKIDVRATARLEGDLITPRIVVVDGAVLQGRVDTQSAQSDPSKPRPQLVSA